MEYLEYLKTIGLVLLAVSLTFRWWRVVVPVAAATLVSWLIDTHTAVHKVWLTYSLMLAALVFGVMWQRKLRRPKPGESSHVLATHGRE